MNDKHLQIRIEQCLALSKASNCPRRKFGALLLDPVRNTILGDGYNGGPRGGGELCGGSWCHRDGFKPELAKVTTGWHGTVRDYRLALEIRLGDALVEVHPLFTGNLSIVDMAGLLAPRLAELAALYPPIESGTRCEVGCHHAEMNVICNAAAVGTATAGAWLIVTGEPCLMCAKLIHHAGIVKVVVVAGGFHGANGIAYLKEHGVAVDAVAGPKDPRTPEPANA